MTQYNTLNINFSNSQPNKLKLRIKSDTDITLNSPPNLINDSNDQNDFPQKLLLTDRHVSRLCKAFENNSTANNKLTKIQLSKIMQSQRFLVVLLDHYQKLSLMETMLKPLTKSILIPSGLTEAALTVDARKLLGWEMMTLISNKENGYYYENS